jgi:phenylpropionate dioxygenase-like ring-hydroxylating dioxygenase large terminal subunit
MDPIHPDISRAKTLDTAFYTDPAYLQIAREKIFSASWQWLGDVSALSSPGACEPVTLLPGMLDEPLLLSRDEQGQLHCLSNVCTHRGNRPTCGVNIMAGCSGWMEPSGPCLSLPRSWISLRKRMICTGFP